MFSFCDFGFYGDVCVISVNCVQIDEIKFYNHKDLSKIINTCRQKPKHQYCKKSTINKSRKKSWIWPCQMTNALKNKKEIDY